MRTREIYLLEDALGDLEQGRAFYDRQGMGVGEYFIECVLSDIGSLRLYAGIHRRMHGLFRKLCRRFPFAIYYEMANDDVQVVAVLDMRREPTWIKKNLSKRAGNQRKR